MASGRRWRKSWGWNSASARFPCAGITSENLEDVDREKYDKLQSLLHKEILEDFYSAIHPVEYDDIMFRRLNR